MRNKFLVLTLASLFIWSACSNDFEVAAPWKDIPVVYGLLSIDDEFHYIRVEKAFLDPDANALEIARVPDSLYYQNISVQLERVSNGQLFDMQRVNGEDVNIPREDGIFATSPNYLYRINSNTINLQPGETIRLILDRKNELPLVTAETVIQGSGIQRNPNPGGKFNFVENLTYELRWSAHEAAKIFDANLTINYAEHPTGQPDQNELKSFDWQWARGKTFGLFNTQYEVFKEGVEFYEVMANSIPDKPGYDRIFIGIDIEIVSGGEELEKYVNVALANIGITGSQEIPSYTNLSEGQGVFSSIDIIKTDELLLSPGTRDSLRFGRITKHLNFK